MSYFRKLYDYDQLPSRAKAVYIYLHDRCDNRICDNSKRSLTGDF